MKIDRLIGIIAVLQSNRKVTMPALAEKFEVSRRTINRDIEAICRAGIPIVTTQGADGGVSIMEGFRLDASVLTAEELASVFIGLKSLDSVSETSRAGLLADKLFLKKDSVLPLAENIVIDLSSHYKDSLAPKIAMIKRAATERRLVSFTYYYGKGEMVKTVEPYLIVFKWAAWYLFGYCAERGDFRLYKLNRLWDLTVTGLPFTPRDIPPESLDFDSRLPDTYEITAVFEASEKYRLVEEYGRDSFTEREDSRLLFCRGFTNHEEAIRWFFSFGDRAEVLAPEEFREKMKRLAENLFKKYS